MQVMLQDLSTGIRLSWFVAPFVLDELLHRLAYLSKINAILIRSILFRVPMILPQ